MWDSKKLTLKPAYLFPPQCKGKWGLIEFPCTGFVNLYSLTVRDYIRDLQATSAEAEEEAYSPGGSGLSCLDPSMSPCLAFPRHCLSSCPESYSSLLPFILSLVVWKGSVSPSLDCHLIEHGPSFYWLNIFIIQIVLYINILLNINIFNIYYR